MKLTEHFSLDELTKTSCGLDNIFTLEVVRNLLYVAFYLEHLRRFTGPIKVNSGYRSPEVNKAVGGVKNSQHITGSAVDITFGSVSQNKARFEDISRYGGFDQLILEGGGQWIHLSVLPPWETQRGQIIRG